jgi:hypothetical protein
MKTPIMKTVVIYHSADFDGIFCREIAHKFLPDAALIGWDYGQPIPKIEDDVERLYMLDISVPELMNDPRLIWIDHHKSAIDKWHFVAGNIPSAIKGYRIDGVAACRLAWQYFSKWSQNAIEISKTILPTKQDFVDRNVSEPLAVRLAGEYDIWDKRDPRAELFQHGLRSQNIDLHLWRWMLGTDCDQSMMVSSVKALLKQGEVIQYAKSQENEGIILSYGFNLEFEGLVFLACNHARFNSHLFTAGIKPSHDALLGFNYDGKNKSWRVSLYHAPGKEHHDLSLIAVKYGGGGHKGACGFRLENISNISTLFP